MLWKVPANGDLRLGLYVRLPEACQQTEAVARGAGGARIERWRATCPDGLIGHSIRIEGLAATRTDVLVRIQHLDGTVQTLRLTPAEPVFQLANSPGPLEVVATCLALGVEHILLGIDHLLFVLALLFLVGSWRQLVGTVTAFTAAHSTTLAAATLGLVHVPQAPVAAWESESEFCVRLQAAQAGPKRRRARGRSSGLIFMGGSSPGSAKSGPAATRAPTRTAARPSCAAPTTPWSPISGKVAVGNDAETGIKNFSSIATARCDRRVTEDMGAPAPAMQGACMDRQSFRNFGSSVAVCTLLLAFGGGAALADSLPQAAQAAFDQKVVARVSAEQALEHIAFLSEAIGPRISGLDGEWEGAEYIASRLESYGYEVELQTFPVADQFIGSIELPSGEQWQMNAASDGRITGEEGVFGELIFVNGGASSDDFPPETAGKIVLLDRARNVPVYRRQVHLAKDAGAIAVILANVVRSPGFYGGAWWPDLNPVDLPVLAATWNQGEWLKDMLDQGPVTLSVQTRRHEALQSVNVIGRKPATNGDPNADAVLVTAHLDSVVGSPGAADNASGVALALELARVFREYNTDKELRFALMGSEERGLLGSRYYVDQLGTEELDRILGVFNADLVGLGDPGGTQFYAGTVDGLPNLVTDAGEAAGARLGNSSLLPAAMGRSDHVAFDEAGVPAALFLWRPVDFWDFYHTPQDTIAESLSLEAMQTALEIVGAAVFDLARKDVPALESSRVRAEP